MLKKYQQSIESGTQTSLVSSTSAGDNDPNETGNLIGIRVMENVEEKIVISSKHSATHRSRKESSIANSSSSRKREIGEMELANLRSKKEAE